jgi:hypothetical protein
MSKSVVKGRPKGTTKSTFFNLIQTNKETQKEKVLGYFTVLGAACEKAAKLQLLQDKSYSLMEFKNEYSNKLENLKKALIYGDN